MVPPSIKQEAIGHSANTTSSNDALLPLTPCEIRTAANATRVHFPGIQLRFSSISLLENSNARSAHVIVIVPSEATAHSLHIVLADEAVVNAESLGDAQPLLSPDDATLAETICKESERVLTLLKQRHGITHANQFRADPWSVHVADKNAPELVWRDDGKSSRLVQCFLYAAEDSKVNQYAHPIDVVPVVDLNAKQVVCFYCEERDTIPIPNTPVEYHREKLGENKYLPTTYRALLKPLHVVQPDGPSFIVNGRWVMWQHWSFTVGFNFREGLVLHDIAYDGRSVIRRASIVEMAVPYFDPVHPFTQKCAFDVGDYGLGYCAQSLSLGCDCLGHIHYFDAVLSNSKGEPYTVEKAICMHEEDVGLAWKHVDYSTLHNESRRARRLVISFIATVVNYEYLFYWYLNIDGSIDFEVKLSGELSTNVLSSGERIPRYGKLVAPSVNAQLHQHMFCARIDPAVDGTENTIEEVNLERVPVSSDNPAGNAVRVVVTPLLSESEGARSAAPARSWRIVSATRMNAITGRPTAYRLIGGTRGGAQPPLLTSDESAVSIRGAFATKSLWVTRRNDMQNFPAGDYPTQSTGGFGVAEWVKRDESIEKAPLSLWHSFGVAHIPRVEDFPVMPCETVGFSLKPDGFFLGNPAVDIPPEADKASVQTDTEIGPLAFSNMSCD